MAATLAGLLCLIVLAPATALASPTGAIAGKVTAAKGGPIAELQVCAYEVPEGFFPDCEETKANGEYEIADLATGSYKVEFLGETCAHGCEQLNYITQYYDDKSTYAEATEVSVTAPGMRSGINASMAEGGKITGNVKASGGGELNKIEVCAGPAAEEYAPGKCTETNAKGEYALEGLAAGSYKVKFYTYNQNYITQYYEDKATFAEAKAVPVSPPSTQAGINASMVEGGKITGKVTAAGAPQEDVEVCAYPVNAGLLYRCTQTDSSGEYTIIALATESYKVEFYPREAYVVEYYEGALTLGSATPVAVTAPNTRQNIDAALSTGAKIAGKVTIAPGGAPAEGIEVCAVPTSVEYHARCGSTNAAGEYTIAGLASGSYSVVFHGEYGCPSEKPCEALKYIEEKYDGKFGNEAPTLVTVVAPATLFGIDGRLVESQKQYDEEEAAAKKREEEAATKKREEEAAVAKRHNEEAAAAKKREEEARRLQEEASATVKITHVKVTTGSVILTIRTSRPGTVTVTGRGLKKTVKTLAAGTHVVKIALTKAGKADRARRRKIKLAVSLKVYSRTVSSSKEVKL